MSAPVADRPSPGPAGLLARALRLRCPACGGGRLFSSWLRMAPACSACRYPFEREPGFFLGSIYVNYGVTAVLVTVAYLTLFIADVLPDWQRLAGCLVFSVAFPLWFHRYARAVWLAFDYRWDPAPASAPPESESTTEGGG